MVSFTVYKPNTGGAYIEGVCLATDEKPIAGITNGSILFSVDTTDGSMTRYMFDQSAGEWIETECPCSGGGSGGGGGGGGDTGGSFVVDVVQEGQGRITATWNELKAAYDAGKRIFMRLTVNEDSSTFYVQSPLENLGTNGEWWAADFTEGEWVAESPDEFLHGGAE